MNAILPEDFPWVRGLPSGNQEHDLPAIKEYCRTSKIPYTFIQFSSGGFFFIFPDVSKFPTEDGQPYVPIGDEGGHSLWQQHPQLILDDLFQYKVTVIESYDPTKE